jgi:phenylalanyl-tRNA synthetase beta chain
MICDQVKPMCIAGVFGGLESGITQATKTVFLESAYFDPASVRKSSKAHGLKTDASFRFERGADPNMTLYALKRAALLIREIAGGTVSSDVLDIYPVIIESARIDFRFDELDRFSGHVLDRNTVRDILVSLGMELEAVGPEGCTVIVPTGKVDVKRPVDLFEEVLRIYGYDNIPMPARLTFSLPSSEGSEAESVQRKTAAFLVANGFNEIFTNSLTRSAYRDSAGNDSQQSVSLLNPLSQDLGVLRQDLLHSGMEVIQYNRNRQQLNLRLFEFGKTYHLVEGKYVERMRLALFMSGNRTEEAWNGSSVPVDFFLMKGFTERLLLMNGIDTDMLKGAESEHDALANCFAFMQGDKRIAVFGQLKRSFAKKFDIQSDTLFADIDWSLVVRASRRKATRVSEIPKFPQVRRDLSMVISGDVLFGRIEELSFKTEKKLLKSVQLFDVFEGEKIGEGKKSYAVSFILQDEQQTLTDQQIDKVMERLMQALEKEVGAVIRKA